MFFNRNSLLSWTLANDFEILSKCFEDFNNFFESTINCYKEQHHFAIVYNCEELEAIKYKKVFDSILDNNGFEMEDFLLMPYDFWAKNFF